MQLNKSQETCAAFIHMDRILCIYSLQKLGAGSLYIVIQRTEIGQHPLTSWRLDFLKKLETGSLDSNDLCIMDIPHQEDAMKHYLNQRTTGSPH